MPTYVSGISGSVQIGAISYAFKKWSMDIDTNLPKVNNFLSIFQQLVAGIRSANLTLEGPYYEGSYPPFIGGNLYIFILNFDNAQGLTGDFLIEKMTPSQDVEDAARLHITARSTGNFSYTIV
jgi:hypothetical protein